MQVALALQYFPADGSSGPITVHTTIDEALIHDFCITTLARAEERCQAQDGDPVAQAIEAAEAKRLREVFDILVREEAGE